jgi:UDP-GlcNAc:undecaprenyl-phosphate GlcNAc-1-phosphate transferase
VDRPGGRKSHIGEVPIVGGAAMFIGFLFGSALLPDSVLAEPYLPLAAGLLVVVGVMDDKYALPTSVRFITHITAVLIMVFGGGLYLHDLGSPFGMGVIELGPTALIVTLLVTVAVINAFNMVDGVDGLAGSLASIALVSIAIVGGAESASTDLALIALAAVFAYLIFNFPVQANRGIRSFMGDAGSTLLGFVIVWVTIGVSQGEGRVASPVICLWFASVPIYDLFTCFVRRIANGNSPFKPGRDHFHHTLKRGGLGVRQVLAILAGLQLIYAAIGLIAHFAGASDVVMFASWALLGISQRWIIRKYAVIMRVERRRRIANDTGNYARPGTF